MGAIEERSLAPGLPLPSTSQAGDSHTYVLSELDQTNWVRGMHARKRGWGSGKSGLGVAGM